MHVGVQGIVFIIILRQKTCAKIFQQFNLDTVFACLHTDHKISLGLTLTMTMRS